MKWLRLMLAAMIANGFALVGAKILTESGLSSNHGDHYLLGWYTSGFAMAMVYSARNLSWPKGKEILIGACMASMSFIGMLCIVSALGGGAPGFIVFPIVTGANVLFVAIGGVVLFKERLGLYGTAGILCGLLSVVILSLP